VERQLEIVGEALSQLGRADASTAAAIPELRRLAGFRNVLTHGYASADNGIVWGLVEANLGPLLNSFESLLAQP
jgi:uncharacterized protein with HEPN domain